MRKGEVEHWQRSTPKERDCAESQSQRLAKLMYTGISALLRLVCDTAALRPGHFRANHGWYRDESAGALSHQNIAQILANEPMGFTILRVLALAKGTDQGRPNAQLVCRAVSIPQS